MVVSRLFHLVARFHLPRPLLWSAAFVAVSQGALGFLPLFAGPGYESALGAGLLVPSAAALGAASFGRRAESADRAVGDGVALGAGLGALAYAIMLLHGLRAGFCDAWAGSVLVLLGPFAGAVLGGAWGGLSGFASGPAILGGRLRRALPWFLALAGPLGSIAISVFRFATSPMVFAYDPFVGFFSGTLYDTVIDSSGLASYRVGTLASIGAASLLGRAWTRTDGIVSVRRPPRDGLTLLGVVALATSVGVTIEGPTLGHYQTEATIAEALGAEARGSHCDVTYASTLRRDVVFRFVAECDGHVSALETWLALPPAERRVRVFLFADSDQKAWLMGAAGTEIAKPWRREIYVQEAGFPHPSLGHELAHVLSGELARGPFRIAGSLGGLWPDPGLIEGMAVAASPRESDLSLDEWARAMKDLDRLPQVARLFGLAFLSEPSSTAYTASGAFVAWVRRTYGAPALAAWYGGKDLAAVVGTPLSEIEARWHAHLDEVPLSEAARAQARERFERPGVFSRACPHEVDACLAEANQLSRAGDAEGALRLFEEAQALDPTNGSARLGHANAWLVDGNEGAAQRELEALLSDESVAPAAQEQARQQLGDRALWAGDAARALRYFDDLAAKTADEDRLRNLDVKRAAAKSPIGRAAVVELLVGAPGRGPDRIRAAALLGAWSVEAPKDGLPHYLLARQYMLAGDFEEAAESLEQAAARTIELPRVAAETMRLRAITACGLGHIEEAREIAAEYAHLPVPASRKEGLAEFAARCTKPMVRRVDASPGPR